MKKLIISLALVASCALAENVNVTDHQLKSSKPLPVVVVTRGPTGATLAPAYYSAHLTTNATATVTSTTAYVNTVQVSVTNAGSAWVIKIQDKSGTPRVLYQATAAVGSTTPVNATVPIQSASGIDIITSGTTPGVADVWITYSQ
jgi:hypothetical protein